MKFCILIGLKPGSDIAKKLGAPDNGQSEIELAFHNMPGAALSVMIPLLLTKAEVTGFTVHPSPHDEDAEDDDAAAEHEMRFH